MSRRDTIIIAILVNAGLLMVLFATAVRSKEDVTPSSSYTEIVEAPKTAPKLSEPLATLPVTPKAQAPLPSPDDIIFSEDLNIALLPAKTEPVAAAPIKEEGKFVNVTVKKGDFLEKIAKSNNTTVAAIMKSNNMSSTALRVGQVLRVPLKPGASAPKTATPSFDQGEFYVVKDGDNPWLIASKNKVGLNELLRLNDLDEQKARRLRPGDRLRIR